jgi:hypothetical protein
MRAGDMLREAAAARRDSIELSCVLLPGKAPIPATELDQARKQSLFGLEFLAPETSDCRGMRSPVTTIAGQTEDDYIRAALAAARGEYLWFVNPADRPDPNLPAALLACFTREDIACVRSLPPLEDGGLMGGKHSLLAQGNELIETGARKGQALLATPTLALFRRATFMERLPEKATGAPLLPRGIAAVHKDRAVALVPSCLLLPPRE